MELAAIKMLPATSVGLSMLMQYNEFFLKKKLFTQKYPTKRLNESSTNIFMFANFSILQ